MKSIALVASSLVTNLASGVRWLFSIRGAAILYLWAVAVIIYLSGVFLGHFQAWTELGTSHVAEEDLFMEDIPPDVTLPRVPRPVSEFVPDSLGTVTARNISEVLVVTFGAMVICVLQVPGWLLLLWRWRRLPLRKPDFWPRFLIWGLAVSYLWISTALVVAHYGVDLYLLSINPEYVLGPIDIGLGVVVDHALLIGLLLVSQSPFWFVLWLLRRWPFLTNGPKSQAPTENLTEQSLRRNAKRYLWATVAIAVVCFFPISYQTIDLWNSFMFTKPLIDMLYLVPTIVIFLPLALGMILLAAQAPAWLILRWPMLACFRQGHHLGSQPFSRLLCQVALIYFWLTLVLFCIALIGLGLFGFMFLPGPTGTRIPFILLGFFLLPFFSIFLVYLQLPAWGTFWWVWHREHPEVVPRSQGWSLGWAVGFLWVPLIVAVVVSLRLTYLTHFAGHEFYIPADMKGFLRHLWAGVTVAQGLGWLALWWHYRQSRRLADAMGSSPVS